MDQVEMEVDQVEMEIVAGSAEFHTKVREFLVQVQLWKGSAMVNYTLGIVLVVESSYFYLIAGSALLTDPKFKGKYTVCFGNGDCVQFQPSDMSIKDGIALIHIRRRKIPVKAVKISAQPARVNQTVYLFSYQLVPSEGRLTPGNVTSVDMDSLWHDCDTLVASVDSNSPGDNGSPLFDTRGQLVGIIDAKDRRSAMDVEGIRKRLNLIFGRDDECMDAILQHMRTIGREKILR